MGPGLVVLSLLPLPLYPWGPQTLVHKGVGRDPWPGDMTSNTESPSDFLGNSLSLWDLSFPILIIGLD